MKKFGLLCALVCFVCQAKSLYINDFEALSNDLGEGFVTTFSFTEGIASIKLSHVSDPTLQETLYRNKKSTLGLLLSVFAFSFAINTYVSTSGFSKSGLGMVNSLSAFLFGINAMLGSCVGGLCLYNLLSYKFKKHEEAIVDLNEQGACFGSGSDRVSWDIIRRANFQLSERSLTLQLPDYAIIFEGQGERFNVEVFKKILDFYMNKLHSLESAQVVV